MNNSLKTLFNSLFPISLFALFTLAIASCENENLFSTEVNQITTGDNIKMLTISEDSEELLPFTTNLMAGQHHIAGTVSVKSDGTNLYVTYSTNCGNEEEDETEEESIVSNVSENDSGSWTLKATHLYVGSCENLPTTNKGNPKIGKFPYKTEHPDGVNEFTYTISLLNIGDCFCLAAHAEVDCGECDDEDTVLGNQSKSSNSDNSDNYCGEETAWADGNDFSGNNWAMYIEFCFEEDEEDQDS